MTLRLRLANLLLPTRCREPENTNRSKKANAINVARKEEKMSIFCTTFDVGMEHTNRCKRVRKLRPKVYAVDDSKPCTCGSAPIKYQGSHILPKDKDARDGWLDLGAIPNHITRDGRDDRPENGQWYPWLRVSVNQETVILTRKQALKLHDSLNAWLENTNEKTK